jgi:hypothetical protein
MMPGADGDIATRRVPCVATVDGVSMRRDLFDELVESAKEMKAIQRKPDVRAALRAPSTTDT